MGLTGDGPQNTTQSALAERAWFALVILFVAAVLSYTDRLILNVLVQPIQHELHLTDTAISYLQGASFAIIYALVGLPLGRIADRYNRRNVILCGILIWSVATALCGLADSFAHFALARVVVGIGEACLAPAAMSMIPDLFPAQRRGTAISVFIAGMTIGGGTATLTGGFLLGLLSSGVLAFLPVVGSMTPWRGVLVLLALPGLLIGVLLLFVPEPARHAEHQTRARLDQTLRFFAANSWMFATIFGAFALMQLVDYGLSAWLPALMSRKFAVLPSTAGIEIGWISILLGGAGTLLGGLVGDRLTARGSSAARLRLTRATYWLLLPTLAFPLMGSASLSLTLYAAYALLSGIAGSAGLSAVQDAVPPGMRGVSVALQAFLYTLFGLGVGPTVVALVTHALSRGASGVDLAMTLVAVPVACLALLLLSLGLLPYARAVAARDLPYQITS